MLDFRSLKGWEKAHALTLIIYRLVQEFPAPDAETLGKKIQQTAIAVPTQLVEGCGKDAEADQRACFREALVSANSLEYLLLLAFDLGYLQEDSYQFTRMDLAEVRNTLEQLAQPQVENP